MPEELRAAYIRSVQEGASPRYAATEVVPGFITMANTAQRFAATLDPSGVSLAPDEQAWSFSFRAAALGCEAALLPLSEPSPEAEGNRVNFRHKGMVEWYLNGPLGLEQGFELSEPPSCSGPKVIALELSGDLRAELFDPDGDGRGGAVRFLDTDGRSALLYGDLFVKDAKGAPLAAWISVDAQQLSIHFEDTGATYPIEVDPLWMSEGRLIASDASDLDHFGTSVAISGDRAIVGAPGDDIGFQGDQGSAYVFERFFGVWFEQAKLIASDGQEFDGFGRSVAISGDTALVGADGDYWKQGSAYVFVRNGGAWTEQAKLVASDGQMGELFGTSAAISGDTALVGAVEGRVSSTFYQGTAYVFVRAAGVWTQQQKLVATDGSWYHEFGNSVALSGDMALVGAFGDDTSSVTDRGSAYVFVRSSGVWVQQTKLVASDGVANDRFGSSVALSGDTALIGAKGVSVDNGEHQGAAYVFAHNAGAWTEKQKLVSSDRENYDYFGLAVALSGDTAVVGMVNDDPNAVFPRSSAYVFVQSAPGVWTEAQQLTANDPFLARQFGACVAVSGDTMMVGASEESIAQGWDQGAVYLFAAYSQPIGAACGKGAQCTSGFCFDGVCCSTACGSDTEADCMACSVARGAAVDGTCVMLSAGAECRSAAGLCDEAETCDGSSITCPADAVIPAGTQCRDSEGLCDVTDACDGTSGVCLDVKIPAGTQCRDSAGLCDVAEACDGANSDCPIDAKAAAGAQCRASAGKCDAAEVCSGDSVDCPADGAEPNGTACSGGVCEGGECQDSSGGNGGAGGAGGSGDTGGRGGEDTSSGNSNTPAGDGGCACRAAETSSPGGARATLGLLGLGLLAARRRRRYR